jgi:large repetitive protein
LGTYGEADPELTYGFSPALIGADTFTGALTRATGEDVTYAITQGTLALSTNYTLLLQEQILRLLPYYKNMMP